MISKWANHKANQVMYKLAAKFDSKLWFCINVVEKFVLLVLYHNVASKLAKHYTVLGKILAKFVHKLTNLG